MKSWLWAIATLLVGVAAIAPSRSWLVEKEKAVKEQSAVYSLPAPAVLDNLSLGYRAALADYLWAHVLVTQGLRLGDRRPFTEMGDYMDAINHLDPRFREPYRLVDSIMTFQANDPDRLATIERVRRILERGVEQFPHDAELWLNYGQFLAYIAPGSFESMDKVKQWREEGAQALVRASALGGHDEVMAFRTVSAATILSKAGATDAAVRFLERAYTLTEDQDVRQDIARRLDVLRAGQKRSEELILAERYDQLWRKDLPFSRRSMLSVLGPPVPTWSCAGNRATRSQDALCSPSWRAWAEFTLSNQRRD